MKTRFSVEYFVNDCRTYKSTKAQIYLICKIGRNYKCKYQTNCAFSFKRKRVAWNKRKDKAMALATQANLAESDKGSFVTRENGANSVMVNLSIKSKVTSLYETSTGCLIF